jgi:hypothetical protein
VAIWSYRDIEIAAEIWQRDYADIYGESDAPKGVQERVFNTIRGSAAAHALGRAEPLPAARTLVLRRRPRQGTVAAGHRPRWKRAARRRHGST